MRVRANAKLLWLVRRWSRMLWDISSSCLQTVCPDTWVLCTCRPTSAHLFFFFISYLSTSCHSQEVVSASIRAAAQAQFEIKVNECVLTAHSDTFTYVSPFVLYFISLFFFFFFKALWLWGGCRAELVQFGPDRNIPAAVGELAVKSCTDINGSQRMNPSEADNPFDFSEGDIFGFYWNKLTANGGIQMKWCFDLSL